MTQPLVTPGQALHRQLRTPLGISGKSLHRPEGKNGDLDTEKRRFIARDELQRIIQGLLYLEGHPVAGCNRNLIGNEVKIIPRADGSNARFVGPISCKDVHVCPVCSSHICEHRRLELQFGIRNHAAKGGAVYLLTLTVPHTLEMPLASILDKLRMALQRFKNCKTYKRILGTPMHPGKYRRIGSVRSLEITVGPNGWHPHTHDLVFCDPGLLDDYRALEELRHEWTRILLKVGLGDSTKQNDMLAHAFDLRGGDYAAEYVAKFGRQPELHGWGITDELTRTHAKLGTKAGHLVPFALPRLYRDGDSKAGALFVEYAKAISGERMVYWSPGLKTALGVKDATDEDLISAPLPDEAPAIIINSSQWWLAVTRNARGELRYWAAKYREQGVTAFLDELAARPKTHRGSFDTESSRSWNHEIRSPFVAADLILVGEPEYRG